MSDQDPKRLRLPPRVATGLAVAGFFTLTTAIAVLIFAAHGAFTPRGSGPGSIATRDGRVLPAEQASKPMLDGAPWPVHHQPIATPELIPVVAKQTPIAAVPPKSPGALRKFEVGWFVEATTQDANGKTVIQVAARSPAMPGTFTGGIKGDWKATAEALNTPRIRCTFDNPPSVLPARGQRVRIVGVTTEAGEPTELEHCEIKPIRPE